MEHRPENTIEKKTVNKAKSCNNGPPLRLRSEATKRKSFNLNEAVMSLDLALGKMKKSRQEGIEYGPPPPGSVARRGGGGGANSELFMDLSSPPSTNISQGLPTSSLMSMNFSHYELMRNLSRSTSNSEGAYSGNTCSTFCGATDSTLKDERLEKYFKSVEMWNRKYRDGPSVHFEIPEK